jgi:hypothetical protein
MKIEDIAALANLPDIARKDLLNTMIRMSAIELACQVRAPEDTNDHLVVRARQFESYVKKG